MVNLTVALIKYFIISECSIFAFYRFADKAVKIKHIFFSLPLTVIISLSAYAVRLYAAPLNLLLMFAFVLIYGLVLFKKPFGTSVVLSTISLSISFILHLISSLLCLPFSYLLFSFIKDKAILNSVIFLIVGAVQFLCLFLFFRIKRFQNGILSFTEKLDSDLSVFFSILILFIASFFYITEENYYKNIIIVFIIIAVGCLLLLWWKKHITNIYLEKVYKRNIEILENSLSEQQEINQKLKQSNEELSSIIHRDNKLIPAMESAVEEILGCNSPDEQKEKSLALLSQLKSMSSERITILSDYENQHKTLVQTGIFSIDASLKYLMNRAIKDNTAFDVSVACDVNEAVNDLISENDLNTLILDLGENALIAVQKSEIRNVLIVFGSENESFTVSIYDSGLPFEQQVIENLGKRRITTHRKTGGSGIGLMTTAQLLKKHNASLMIDESIDNESYVKKVSVIFDGLNQLRVITQTNKITRSL